MWIDQSNSKAALIVERNKTYPNLFYTNVFSKKGGGIKLENMTKILEEHSANIADNVDTTIKSNSARTLDRSVRSRFSVETVRSNSKQTKNGLGKLLGRQDKSDEPTKQDSAYCDHALLVLDVNNFQEQKLELSCLFSEGDTIENFSASGTSMYQSLEECLKEKVVSGDELSNEIKQKMLRNIFNSHYYITISVNDKMYHLNTENMARYFRYCCRKQIIPRFTVHFLSTVTRKQQFSTMV